MGRYADGSYYADSNLSTDIQAAGMMGYNQAQPQQVKPEDEEEQDYRKYRLLQASKDMDMARQERSMRQGYYTSPEQMVGDQYSPLYSRQPDMSRQISMDGAQFPGMRRTVAPDANQRLSMFSQANQGRGSNSISMEDFAKREEIKTGQRVKAEQAINQIRQEAKSSGQQFDASKAKAMILSRNPGGIDPATLDKILDPYTGAQQPSPSAFQGIPILGDMPMLQGLGNTLGQAMPKPVADPNEKIVVDVAPIKQAAAQSTQAMQAGQPQSGGGGQFVPQDAATWQKFIQSWQKKNPGKKVSEAIQEYQARGGQ